MKLVRFGKNGEEKPGLIDADGTIRDLSAHISDISGDNLLPASLQRLRELDTSKLPEVSPDTRLGSCVGDVHNFLGVGLNFVDHAKESNLPIPEEPLLFNKSPYCTAGPNDDVIIPPGSKTTDWEVEIAIVIGAEAYRVSEAEAADYIAGYCLSLDVSERDAQHGGTGQWVKGKSYPTFGPLGPYLVTKDEIDDVNKLGMTLDLNQKRVQDGNTEFMVFDVIRLVADISHYMCLKPGDVITTGTPAGVGAGMKPQVFLKAGDQVDLAIDQLGKQSHQMV